MCSGNLESLEPPQYLPLDPGIPRKTLVEVASPKTFRILTFLHPAVRHLN
jgi:hypothetical protein